MARKFFGVLLVVGSFSANVAVAKVAEPEVEDLQLSDEEIQELMKKGEVQLSDNRERQLSAQSFPSENRWPNNPPYWGVGLVYVHQSGR